MKESLFERKLKYASKIGKILTMIEDESEAPVTYYVIDHLCGALGLPVPAVSKIVQALRDQGFQAVPTHFNPKAVKSDVPSWKMKEILGKIAGSD
jgi:tRNA (guanine26-N2/guanine27-N2)-dimethyltransferase